MSAGERLLWGAFVSFIGLLPDFWRVMKVPQSSRPQWPKSKLFWLGIFLRMFFGAGVVLAYIRSGTPLNPILSINVGASLPFFIRTVGQTLPKINPNRID